MKRVKIIIIAIFCLFTLNTNAKIPIPILYGLGEEISLVKELPQDQEFTIQADNGRWYHANLGVMHEQFSLFSIPIYNFGTYRYVLYTDTKIGKYDYTYLDLSQQDIAYLQTMYSGIPNEPELPFWDSIGGKIVIIGVGIILFLFLVKKNE